MTPMMSQWIAMITMTAAAVRLLLVLGLCCPSFSFSSGIHKKFPARNLVKRSPAVVIVSPLFGTRRSSSTTTSRTIRLRGGDQLETEEPIEEDIIPSAEIQQPETLLSASFAPMASKLASLGAAYGASLEETTHCHKKCHCVCHFRLVGLACSTIRKE